MTSPLGIATLPSPDLALDAATPPGRDCWDPDTGRAATLLPFLAAWQEAHAEACPDLSRSRAASRGGCKGLETESIRVDTRREAEDEDETRFVLATANPPEELASRPRLPLPPWIGGLGLPIETDAAAAASGQPDGSTGTELRSAAAFRSEPASGNSVPEWNLPGADAGSHGVGKSCLGEAEEPVLSAADPPVADSAATRPAGSPRRAPENDPDAGSRTWNELVTVRLARKVSAPGVQEEHRESKMAGSRTPHDEPSGPKSRTPDAAKSAEIPSAPAAPAVRAAEAPARKDAASGPTAAPGLQISPRVLLSHAAENPGAVVLPAEERSAEAGHSPVRVAGRGRPTTDKNTANEAQRSDATPDATTPGDPAVWRCSPWTRSPIDDGRDPRQSEPPTAKTGLAPACDFDADRGPVSPGPLKELEIGLRLEENTPIRLRLQDAGGHVHVTVRSNDPWLAGEVRADLGELRDRLQRSGYETEVWTPEAAHADEPPASSAHRSPDEGMDADPRRGRQEHRSGSAWDDHRRERKPEGTQQGEEEESWTSRFQF